MDAVMPIWRELHEAFALNLQVEDIIAEGDTVAVRYVERGTLARAFRGHPVTGKSYEIAALRGHTPLQMGLGPFQMGASRLQMGVVAIQMGGSPSRWRPSLSGWGPSPS
jgi:hypothetical protein